MKKILITLAAGLMLAMNAMPAMAGKTIEIKKKVNGYLREGTLYLPDGIKEDAPIVVVVHGYGGYIGYERIDMEATADRHGFAVFCPRGLKDPVGNPGFNVGYPMQNGWKVDDVDAICKLTKYLQKTYKLSKKNAFMTGMSNGGDLCYQAALEGQKTFAALAPIAGLCFTSMYKIQKPHHAIPLFEVHGTEDRVSEWGGDIEGKGGWSPYISVPLAVNYWVAKARCKEEVRDTIPSKTPETGRYIIRHFYKNNPENIEVWLYEVVGGSHCWHEQDLDTGEEIWKFFSKYLK